MLTKIKEVKTEFIINELRDVLSIVLYLAVSLCLVATFKGLILFQLNINEFVSLYSVAVIEALILGKVVALTQHLPIMNALDNQRLIWSVLYKSVLMTIIVNIANTLEDRIMAHSGHHLFNHPLHPIMFLLAHETLLIAIFFVLYAARGFDRRLGHGTLVKLLIAK